MQGTFIGFNTAGIKYEDRFFALMLKTKLPNQLCQNYYLQAQALVDLLMVLQNRMAIIAHRMADKGESYKSELIAYNEVFLQHTPPIDMSELNQPSAERRIVSITLKPGETSSTLILVLQNERIETLQIDDMQVEVLLMGIQQALKNTGDQKIFEFLNSNINQLLLYAVDLTKDQNIDYQQYPQDHWRINLFTHYLGVLFCCDTAEGKKIMSGAVIKTSVPHHSAEENSIVMRLIELSPKLKTMHEQQAPVQIFSTLIASPPGKMLTLEECLRPLHTFYVETQTLLNA